MKFYEEIKKENSVQFGKATKEGFYFKQSSLYWPENTPEDEIWIEAEEVYHLNNGELITHKDKLVVRYYLVGHRVLCSLYEFYQGYMFENKIRKIAIDFLNQHPFCLSSEQGKIFRTLMAKESIELRLTAQLKIAKDLTVLQVKDFLAACDNGIDDIENMTENQFSCLAKLLLNLK